MRIAIAGVITKKIKPHSLGGTEAFTYLLIDGLVKRGHEVTLYCAKGSQTSAQHVVEICDASEAMGEESNVELVYPYSLLEIRKIMEDVVKGKFDILHVNFLKTFLLSFFAPQINLPIVYTIHRDFFQNKRIYDVYERIGYHENENFVFVSKSAHNASLLKKNDFDIFNGINLHKYPFSPSGGENLLWLSRVDPLKGPRDAIIASKKADKPLIMSGDIDRQKYQDYFDQELRSLISGKVIYEKPQSLERNIKLFHQAKAFLFPIQWEEPCPLTVLESMACGTPLIAFARGSLTESMVDGETGFLINPSGSDIRGNWIIKEKGIEGLVEGIKRIYGMPKEKYEVMRSNCRKRVEANFTVGRMIENYEALYRKIIGK